MSGQKITFDEVAKKNQDKSEQDELVSLLEDPFLPQLFYNELGFDNFGVDFTSLILDNSLENFVQNIDSDSLDYEANNFENFYSEVFKSEEPERDNFLNGSIDSLKNAQPPTNQNAQLTTATENLCTPSVNFESVWEPSTSSENAVVENFLAGPQCYNESDSTATIVTQHFCEATTSDYLENDKHSQTLIIGAQSIIHVIIPFEIPITEANKPIKRKTASDLANDLLVVQNAIKLLENAIENVKKEKEDPRNSSNENENLITDAKNNPTTSSSSGILSKRGRPKKNLEVEKQKLKATLLKVKESENTKDETEKEIAKMRQNIAASKSRDNSNKKVELIDLLLEFLKSEQKILNKIHKRGEKKMKKLIKMLI